MHGRRRPLHRSLNRLRRGSLQRHWNWPLSPVTGRTTNVTSLQLSSGSFPTCAGGSKTLALPTAGMTVIRLDVWWWSAKASSAAGTYTAAGHEACDQPQNEPRDDTHDTCRNRNFARRSFVPRRGAVVSQRRRVLRAVQSNLLRLPAKAISGDFPGTQPHRPALAGSVGLLRRRSALHETSPLLLPRRAGFPEGPGLRLSKLEVIMHRSARCGLYFVVGVTLLFWLPALSLTYPGEEVVQHSHGLVRLVQQQCDQRIGPFARQDTAWSRWREARGQGLPVSVGIDACYDASGTKGYCFNIFAC